MPNLGSAFNQKIGEIALSQGVPEIIAGNVVWSLFFFAGFFCNAIYCLYLIYKGKSFQSFFNKFSVRNWALILAMSLLWMSSFYFYGLSISYIGEFGVIIGWPIFVSLSIVFGNLWGIRRGEWKEASQKSKRLMSIGIAVLIISVIVIASSNIDY